MNPRRQLAWVILLAAAALVYWQVAHRQLASPAHDTSSSSIPTEPQPQQIPRRTFNASGAPLSNTTEELVAPEATATPQRSSPPVAVSAPAVLDTPESSNLPAATVLENLRTTVRQYAAAFGENPVGTNPEITNALKGDNPKNISFLKEDGNRVNGKGELVDVWGTPYFFHQISGHEMELRSAGPDRVMYTGDDLVTR